MRKGKELLMATREFAKENRTRSWYCLITTMLVFAVGFFAVFSNINLALSILGSLLIGLTTVRMFILTHDYLHNAIFQDSLIGRIIFTLYGLYILTPPSIWRRSHDYHHNHNSKLYTSSIGSFPICTKEQYLSAGKMDKFLYLFIRNPFTIALGYVFAFIYGMCVKSFISSPKKHWDSLVSLVLHFGVGYFIYRQFGFTAYLLGFQLSFFLSHAIGAYLFYAQHNFPDVEIADKDNWTYEDAALLSSSHMKMSPIMNWFTGNIGYHHIHHLNAKIPFYRLPEAFEKLPELQHPKTTSFHPKDIWACLRIKVWDNEKRRMISLSEVYANN